MIDLNDARPPPQNRGADRPKPNGVRKGRRASLIYIPRDLLEIKGERTAKKTSSLCRLSLSPLYRVSLVHGSLPLLVDVPRHPEGMCICVGDIRMKKASALASAHVGCPHDPPGFFSGTKVPPRELTSDRTLHLQLARPSSNLVLSDSPRAHPGSHSLIFGVLIDNGYRE
jgi:hypothetical protein